MNRRDWMIEAFQRQLQGKNTDVGTEESAAIPSRPEVNTGLGGIGQVRSGREERPEAYRQLALFGGIPEERAIPGLPPPTPARTSRVELLRTFEPQEVAIQQSMNLAEAGYQERRADRTQGGLTRTEAERERSEQQGRQTLPQIKEKDRVTPWSPGRGEVRAAFVREQDRGRREVRDWEPETTPIDEPRVISRPQAPIERLPEAPSRRGSRYTPGGVTLESAPSPPNAMQRMRRVRAQMEITPGEAYRDEVRSRNTTDLEEGILEEGGEELMEQLTAQGRGGDRPYEGALVDVSPSGAVRLPRGERTAYAEMDGDPGDSDPQRTDGPVIGGKRLDREAPRRGIREAGKPWSESTAYPNFAVNIEVPWVNSDGSMGTKSMTLGGNAETLAPGGKTKLRVDDFNVVDPDSTQTSETYLERTGADVLRGLRDEAKTPVMAASTLNERMREGRARRLTPEEDQAQGGKGTLVGYLDGKGIYDPRRPLSVRRTVPDGDFRSREINEKGYRVGNAMNRDMDRIRETLLKPLQPGTRDTKDMEVSGPIVPGMGFEAAGPVRKVPEAYLDSLEKQGAAFLVQNRKTGEVAQLNSWREALPVASKEEDGGVLQTMVQLPGYKKATPLRAVVVPAPKNSGMPASVRYLIGDEGSKYQYTGPAIFSPDYQQRRKAENMAGSMEEQISDMIASGGSRMGNSGALEIGYSGGAGAIREALERNAILPDGHPKKIDHETLVSALLQTSKNDTSREAVIQALQEMRFPPQRDMEPRRIGEFMGEEVVGDPASGPILGGDDFEFDAIAAAIERGVNPEAARAIAEMVEMDRAGRSQEQIAAVRDGAVLDADDILSDAGIAHEVGGGIQQKISNAEFALAPGNPMAPYVQYALGLLGALDARGARGDIGHILQNVDRNALEWAVEMTDSAMRHSPGNPLNALEEMVGNQVGSASMSPGRQAYADDIRDYYRNRPIPGVPETKYEALVQALRSRKYHEAAEKRLTERQVGMRAATPEQLPTRPEAFPFY